MTRFNDKFQRRCADVKKPWSAIGELEGWVGGCRPLHQNQGGATKTYQQHGEVGQDNHTGARAKVFSGLDCICLPSLTRLSATTKAHEISPRSQLVESPQA